MRKLTLLTSLTCALVLALVGTLAPRVEAAEPAASVERLRQLNLPCWSEEALAGFEFLTRAEQVALLDEMYYRAVNCPAERDSNSDISGGGGGGGGSNSNSDNGGGDGGGGNGGNSGNSNSNSDAVDSDIGNSDIATGGVGVAVGDGIRGEQPADKGRGVTGETAEGADEVAVRSATGGTTGVHTPNDRTTPSDIPPADNDDIIARQLRQAALDETDAGIKAKLWDEYRRYVGIAVQAEGGSDGGGKSASEQ